MPTILLSVPGLRADDVAAMPSLRGLGDAAVPLRTTLPALTCSTQSTFTTGTIAAGHGVVANGFFWRGNPDGKPYDGVEMWTAWSDVVEGDRLWDRFRAAGKTTAVWFPMLAKGVTADFVCTPAPIHNPDGSESLWCYTRPEAMYGELRDRLGHFPLQHFWGPMASIAGSDWIVDSYVLCADEYRPDFAMIYLPHLDYAAQKDGPDSPAAVAAVAELDAAIGRLRSGCEAAYEEPIVWIVAGEYAITSVDRVAYPNRILREAGFLSPAVREGREFLDPQGQRAWALCDHQVAHVFVREPGDVDAVAGVLRSADIGDVLTGAGRGPLDHERSGEVVLVAEAGSWLAYYWWLDDTLAPPFARQVDIHNKPGYDPAEMHVDAASMSAGTGPTPLDASLIGGSHGRADAATVLLGPSDVLTEAEYRDTDVMQLVFTASGL